MGSDKVFVYALLMMLMASVVSGFASAQGSNEKIRANEVILIHNVYDLQNMSKNLSGHYALANDINATITKTWNNGSGFVPIGNKSAPFKGTFDGRGFSITGLFINSSADYVGLFGYISSNATLENVSLVNVSVSASGRWSEDGGLVGYNGGIVRESYATGNVSGYYVGGLVGVNHNTVRDSYAMVNVSGYYAGGLVGWDEYGGVVNNSHYDVDTVRINGGHYLTIGGLYDAQFNDWLSHGMNLDISNYPSLAPDGNYYDISSVQGLKDLLGFAEDSLKFKLTAEINLADYKNFYIPYFVGVFNGDNHTISNINVNISFVEAVSLLGINGGTVENIDVVNASMNGTIASGVAGENYGTVSGTHTTGNVSGHYAGGLVGENYGTVRDSYATGNVSGDYFVGGLAGFNHGTVRESYATDNVVSRGYYAGGLVGYNNYGLVNNSYATGSVTGYYGGGLLGENYYGLVNNSYATGSVTGYYAGGLVGSNYRGMIIDSYATGNVVSSSEYSSEAGGLVGENEGTVNNSHATGNVSASGTGSDTGGLAGYNGDHGTICDSYSTGNATGYYAGGLVGWDEYGSTISDSYAMGSVKGWYYAGGLVGENEGTVNNSHATGNVSGNTAGGLVGVNHHTVRGSYAIVNVSGHYAGGLLGENYGNSNYNYAMSLVSGYYAGGLIGYNKGIMSNSYATGNVSGIYVGGLVGENRGMVIYSYAISNVNSSGNNSVSGGLVGWNYGTVSNSYATGNVSASGNYSEVGGLVGKNNKTVNNTYATGNVIASGDHSAAGGLVGGNGGTVRDSYATGNVSGIYAGGLVGRNRGTVNDSYSTGNVSGNTAGGLVGYNSGTISDSYETGSVIARGNNSLAGGLVGKNDKTVTASFWDVDTSGISTSAGGVGKTTAEMMNEYTFLNANWDFNHTWGIWNGKTYPFLRWQGVKSISSAPLNLQAKTGNRSINLTWQAPETNGGLTITEYKIYRSGTYLTTVSATQLWYNDTGLVNGVNYTYYVTAVNTAGESPKSNEVSATPMTVPGAPQNLTAKVGNGYVNLTWKAPSSDGGSAITGYRIYRNGTLIATVSATQLWYNDTNVSAGYTYTYTVTAVNAAGESPKSNEVQPTPGGAVPEFTPTLMGFVVLIAFLAIFREKR